MKKLLIVLLLLSISSVTWAAGEPSQTVPVAGASFMSNLQSFLRQEFASWFSGTGLTNYVHAGGLHSTAASCTASAISLDAYTSSGNHITADGAAGTVAINYSAAGIGANCANPGSDVCWVVGSSAGQDFTAQGGRTVVTMPVLPGSDFARVGTSNLYVDCTPSTTTDPALPADSVYLLRVLITNGAITNVLDLRKPSSYARAGIYDVTDPLYGAKGDNVTDDTTAIQTAINGGRGHIVFFPTGIYLVSSTLTAANPHTVHMIGQSGQGTNTAIRRADSMSGNLVVFSYAGSVMEHLFLYDGGTDVTKVGAALKLIGTSTIDRASFVTLNDIHISSAAVGGAWQYGLYADGSNLHVAGGGGIRDLMVSNSSFFGVRTPGKTIFLDSCAGCAFSNVGIFESPTAINQGIYIQGYSAPTNWSSDIRFSNVLNLGNLYAEGEFITYMGGSLGSVTGGPTISIPATSTYVVVNSAVKTDDTQISNLGQFSYVVGREIPVGSTVANATFPTGTGRINGLTITGQNGTPDYQGITRVKGTGVHSNPVARLMAAILSGNSQWEFGVSDSYGAGVNKVPFRVDHRGAYVYTDFSLRYEGQAFANLGTLAINGTITYCPDCTIANPCAGAGTGAFAKRLNGVWVCN